MPKNKQSLSLGQKGFAHLFLLLLLVAGIGIGIYLVQHPAIFNPHASTLPICSANNKYVFGFCLEQASKGLHDTIEIDGMIEQSDPFAYSIQGRTTPLTIQGKEGKISGFRRPNAYKNDTFLWITNSNDVTLKNLTFDDVNNNCPFVNDPDPNQRSCGSFLFIWSGSKRTKLDHMTFLNSRGYAVQIAGTDHVTISNSKFINSFFAAIFNGSDILPGDGYTKIADITAPSDRDTPVLPNGGQATARYLTIENNLFKENNTGSMNFTAIGSPSEPNRLINNLFVANHNYPRHCSAAGCAAGSHFSIDGNMHSIIENNVIISGAADQSLFPGLKISGIEPARTIHNVTIKNNIIANNSGAAVFADTDNETSPDSIGAVSIIDNKLVGNGDANNPGIGKNTVTLHGVINTLPIILPNHPAMQLPLPADIARDKLKNCDDNVGANCGLNIVIGKIYANPDYCTVNSQGICAINVKWDSYGTQNVQVKIAENSSFDFGKTPTGQRSLDVTQAGAHLDLYLNGNKVDSVFIQGISTSGTPLPPSADTKRKADVESIKKAVAALQAAKGGWCATYSCGWDSPANNATYGMEGTAPISMKAALVTPGYLSTALHDPKCPTGVCSNWNDYYLSIVNDNDIKIYAKLDTDPGTSTCQTQAPDYNYCIRGSAPPPPAPATNKVMIDAKPKVLASPSLKPAPSPSVTASAPKAISLLGDAKRKDDLANIKKAIVSAKTAKKSWCKTYGCVWGSVANDSRWGMRGSAANSMKAAFVTPGYLKTPLNDPKCPNGTCSNWSDYSVLITNDNKFAISARLETAPSANSLVGCTVAAPYNYCISQ